MKTTTVKPREASIVSDRHLRNIMGFPVWEALPARDVPYELSDPFLLVHEATLKISPAMANLDTEHPHRGFDNLWYVLKGTTSTGHTTGPAGKIERARLPEGSLLHLRTGRGVRHAEGIGADELREGLEGSEVRGVLFWVNLARRDKQVEPTARIVQADDLSRIQEGDATSRILVGEGSTVPFIARYRKEATAGLDEQAIRRIEERGVHPRRNRAGAVRAEARARFG